MVAVITPKFLPSESSPMYVSDNSSHRNSNHDAGPTESDSTHHCLSIKYLKLCAILHMLFERLQNKSKASVAKTNFCDRKISIACS